MYDPRTILRRSVGVLTILALGAGAAACSSDEQAAVVTEVVSVTASAPADSSETPPPTNSGNAGRGVAALKSGFAEFSAGLAQPVGVSIAPVGGGAVISLGDQDPQVAWSTIKVPLAVAAQRKNGRMPAEQPAIVDSDNAAAEQLWASLGTPEQAAQAVTAVLREGGDQTTVVPSERRRAEFSVFGQTVWALDDAASFTANLPCLPDSEYVISLMGQVSGNQTWGIEAIPGRTTAVKGGWGPGESGGYIVRQIGLLTRKDGLQTAFALSTYAPGASMGSGTAVLDQVGRWLGGRLASMPGGRC
ncbi:hypothetical protein [Gordonia caeni]|uniref:Serine hydrolase n=1 Tax=Gordonia caeni TaxID=1007097 RepID=A0ABP7PGA9_9ACTN